MPPAKPATPTKSARPGQPQTQPSAPAAAPTPRPSAPQLPSYRIDADGPQGVDRLLNTEWLLTNGLGGFAMGTVAGVPARRYHGLLIAAESPPVGRIMALNAIAERVLIGGGEGPSFDLSTFRFCGFPPPLHPNGISRLRRFEQDLTCRWTYEVRESGAAVEITKELHLLDHTNAAQVRYRLRRLPGESGKGVELRIRPLTGLRDFHGLIRQSWADRFSTASSGDGTRVSFNGHGPELHLRSDWATFHTDPQWWFDFYYQFDGERGQDCVEDLFSPGDFRMTLAAGQNEASTTIQAATTPMAIADAGRDLTARRARLTAMLVACGAEKEAAPLVAASDAFVVVRRSPGTHALDQTSVIAGYPWFADWGRDTSVSLAGLMLATGRLDDARRTLLAFASHRRNGIVPNVFNDRTGEPEYNTVDASLWFILGACAYRKKALATGDRSAWDGHLAAACLDIVACYRRGTDFNIAMDPQDKLITAGTSATQLTWMDAKRDGVTFTPRHGKAVEINALWHAALNQLAEAIRDTDASTAASLRDLAATVGRSIRALFWNERLGCLYDCLTPSDGGGPGWHPCTEIRPNQLFAVSLPNSPLSIEQQRSVLSVIRERLLTPFGVRTLDPADPNFRGRYEGNLFERDRAYHNGTAWPWLLGPYAEAVLRVGNFSDAARKEARAALEPILAEMSISPTRRGPLGCIGQLAEIYDGDSPQRPQGCPAQAWSVAEILRAMLLKEPLA